MLIALTSCSEAGGSPAVDADDGGWLPGALVVPCPFGVLAGLCRSSTMVVAPAPAPSTASSTRAIFHHSPDRRLRGASGRYSGQPPAGAAAPDRDPEPGWSARLVSSARPRLGRTRPGRRVVPGGEVGRRHGGCCGTGRRLGSVPGGRPGRRPTEDRLGSGRGRLRHRGLAAARCGPGRQRRVQGFPGRGLAGREGPGPVHGGLTRVRGRRRQGRGLVAGRRRTGPGRQLRQHVADHPRGAARVRPVRRLPAQQRRYHRRQRSGGRRRGRVLVDDGGHGGDRPAAPLVGPVPLNRGPQGRAE